MMFVLTIDVENDKVSSQYAMLTDTFRAVARHYPNAEVSCDIRCEGDVHNKIDVYETLATEYAARGN